MQIRLVVASVTQKGEKVAFSPKYRLNAELTFKGGIPSFPLRFQFGPNRIRPRERKITPDISYQGGTPT